jgi:hypothetical protein
VNRIQAAAQAANTQRHKAERRRKLVYQCEDEERADTLLPETTDSMRHEHDCMLLGAKALMWIARRHVGSGLHFPIQLTDKEQMEPHPGEHDDDRRLRARDPLLRTPRQRTD